MSRLTAPPTREKDSMSPKPPPMDDRPTVDGRSTRRASLAVRATKSSLFRKRGQHFVILTASNGEPLLYGETHPTWRHASRSKDAVIRAMVQVLEDEGYNVVPSRGESPA